MAESRDHGKEVEADLIQSEVSQLSEKALEQSLRLNTLLRQLNELVGGEK